MSKQNVLSEKQLAEMVAISESRGIHAAFDHLADEIVADVIAEEKREKAGLRRSQMDYLDNVVKPDGDLACSLFFLVQLIGPLVSGRRVDLTQQDLIAARTLARQASLELERVRKVLEALRGDIVS